ncbi:MAG TPA: HlyD family secretion protein [Opitutaceae bacterium]
MPNATSSSSQQNAPDQEQVHSHERAGQQNDSGKPRNAQNKPAGKPWYKKPLVVGIVFLVLIVVAVAGTLLWLNARKYESTEDAEIDVDSQQVSPRVAGRIAKIFVNDNEEVAAGQVLAELDPADYQSLLMQAQAAAAQAQGQLAQARAQKSVFESQVDQARANLGVAQANAENAQSQLTRLQGLRADNLGAVSQEQLDNAVAAQKTSAAQTEAARKAVAAAEAQLKYADSMIEAGEAGVSAALAKVEQAKLNLGYTKIYADIPGRISRKQVALGNNMQPGTPIMAVVPRDVYITANFKETQLARMRRGQHVKVHVDAYPELDLFGHVDSFQAGTGQAFSGLPAENATGNWVKVVQRVPVKIVLDQIPNDPERRLGPGMSVEVKVSIEP